MKINLNTTIRVTLTEYGLMRLRAYYRDLAITPPPEQNRYKQPVVFLLWEAMHIFGPMLYHGAVEIPFVDNVIEVYPVR